MRYLKFGVFAGIASLFFASVTLAQTQSSPSSSGALADFASSARTRLNYYRALAKLPPIVDDSVMSAGAYEHARYLVKNGIGGGDIVLEKRDLRFETPQDAFRFEVKGKPFYSEEGASAGRHSVIVTAPAINLSGAEFVDRLMTMPFSGPIAMVPQFSTAGLGAYCDPGDCAIVIMYRFRLEKSVRIALYDGPASDRFWNPGLGLIPEETGRLRLPVEFPPDGATVALQSYRGPDYPDPLPSCPGYKAPTGSAISIQLGEGYGPDGSLEVSSHLVSRDDAEIETCLITAASYQGRNDEETEGGKLELKLIGAAIIIPREPLAPGHYKVALKEAGKLYEWGFTVAAPASPAQAAIR
jgi:hypothetical protein